LTEYERNTIMLALRIAAEQYDRDATDVLAASPRTHQQFEKQAREARELSEVIENAEPIEVTL